MDQISITAADIATKEILIVTLSDGSCRLLTPEIVEALPVHRVDAIAGVSESDAKCLDGVADAQEQSGLKIKNFYEIPE